MSAAVSRRRWMGGLAAGAASLGGWSPQPAWPQSGRALNVSLLGFSLGIHVPAIGGLLDVLPTYPGYAPPKIERFSQIETLTTTLISKTAEIGECDTINALRAIEAGANLKFIGNVYRSSDLVFIANADKIRDYADLIKPSVTVAVNGKGDGTYVLLVGPLLKRKVDPEKMTIVEIGGSGARLQGLLSKRVDAVPIHLDQVAEVQKLGNYKVLLEPWQEYRAWSNEVWVVDADWLRKPENGRAATDLLKATLTGFRRAGSNFDWYLDEYHKRATLSDSKTAPAEQVRPQWQALGDTVKAWPASGDFSLRNFQDLMPVYKAAKAIQGTVKLEQVVDATYMQAALKELGR